MRLSGFLRWERCDELIECGQNQKFKTEGREEAVLIVPEWRGREGGSRARDGGLGLPMPL